MRVFADARMEMRLSALDKKVLTQAATLLETNASAFILNAALIEARRVLDSVQAVWLAPKDFRVFVAALEGASPIAAGLSHARDRLLRARAGSGFPIEPLDARQHGHETFDTGLPVVDGFLRHRAAPFARRGLSRTYVVPEAGPGPRARLLASYTLSKADVRASVKRRREPGTAGPAGGESLPVLRLSCFAVATTARGRGLGELLVADAVERARTSVPLGDPSVLVVDTPDADALRWYERFGFAALPSSPATAYLSLTGLAGPT